MTAFNCTEQLNAQRGKREGWKGSFWRWHNITEWAAANGSFSTSSTEPRTMLSGHFPSRSAVERQKKLGRWKVHVFPWRVRSPIGHIGCHDVMIFDISVAWRGVKQQPLRVVAVRISCTIHTTLLSNQNRKYCYGYCR